MIVMLVTTLLMIPVMLLVWRCHWILVLTFAGLSLAVELPYISVLFKLGQAGWVPLGISAIFLVIMYVWHYGTKKRYEFEMQSRVSLAWILSLGPSLGLVRVPGVGLIYTELANGVPHIFSHFITNLPAIHSVVVFVCVKYLPVYTVPAEERIIVKRIGPKNIRMFRCVVRYGYKDIHKKDNDFEKMLFDTLAEFIRMESMLSHFSSSGDCSLKSIDLLIENEEESIGEMTSSSSLDLSAVYSHQRGGGTGPPSRRMMSLRQSMEDELDFLNRAKDAGVVHFLGNTVMRAQKGSGLLKKIAVDYIYAFLKKICRENSVCLNLPHESLLNVGQIFYV